MLDLLRFIKNMRGPVDEPDNSPGVESELASMPESPRVPIVGIGASAGGVEALEELFRSMSTDIGLAYVVVTHLGPGHTSMLPEIIGRQTTMPVAHLRDDDDAAANRVYVLPPDTIVTSEDGRLRLHRTSAAQREHNPIDIFFASLAEDRRERAVGIVLSGSGSDGTIGIKMIKEHGVLTIAQGSDGSHPRYPSMPESAIASGLVDLVVPVEQIPAKLANFARNLDDLAEILSESDRQAERVTTARLTVCQLLRNQTGHDFSGYKPATVLRRIHRRMEVLQLDTIESYVERLRGDRDETARLFQDVLIGVTRFFSDEPAFEALQRIVPRLFEQRSADEVVRVWVAGCSTGEEAYTIALLLREHMETLRVAPRVQIFATDIHETALEIARSGRYPAPLLRGLSPERLARFFIKDGESYVTSKALRELCAFSVHSIIRDPPFSRIDLISCRNLLIYLGPELQKRVLPLFHYALRPGGFLFLGTSESASQYADLFAPVDKAQRVFQKREYSRTRVPFALPTNMPRRVSATGGTAAAPQAGGPPLRAAVEAHVLERFAPAHVLVNREGEILHYSAGTGKYLEPAAGAPNRQVFAAARRGLRAELRGALNESMQTRQRVVRDNVVVEVDDRSQPLRLVVEPFDSASGEALFLVLFIDRGPPLSPEETAATRRSSGDGNQTVEQLERELAETRDRLQSTIEGYETSLEDVKSSQEEMVSMNEELQSTNEEMETSKEELQSVNEELQTVNSELNLKIEALDRANNDLKNLFESTQIATVFLDNDLVIRSFTPAMTPIFQLIPGDKGRPLTDIVAKVDYPELRRDIQTVFDTHQPVERRCQSHSDAVHYLARVLPYRGSEGALDGVIVTFIDVTKVVRGEELKTLAEELNHRVRNMLTVVVGLARLTLLDALDPKAEMKTFVSRLHAMARAYNLLSKRDWGEVDLHDVVDVELAPYAHEERPCVTIEGPAIRLTSKAALAVNLVVHELVTNAAKYGALSRAGGDVQITWSVIDEAGSERLVLDWRERNGPPVAAPKRKGFGTQLIEQQVGHGLGGKLDLTYAADGFRARLDFPLGPKTVVSKAHNS